MRSWPDGGAATVAAVATIAIGAWIVSRSRQGTGRAAAIGVALAALLVVAFGPGIVAPVALFVLGGGTLTRIGRERKESLGAAEAGGGRRSAWQVLAKLGVPAVAALLALAWAPARFWCAVAAVAAVAGAFADTAATEVGPLARGAAWRWSGGRISAARHGQPGGVSVAGSVAGALAAIATVALAAAAEVVPFGIIAAVAASAVGASFVESVVAGTRCGSRLGHHGRNVLVSALSALGATMAVGITIGGAVAHG